MMYSIMDDIIVDDIIVDDIILGPPVNVPSADYRAHPSVHTIL